MTAKCSCVNHGATLTVCLSHQLYIDATEVLKGQEKLDTKSFLPRLVVVFLIHFLCENFGSSVPTEVININVEKSVC